MPAYRLVWVLAAALFAAAGAGPLSAADDHSHAAVSSPVEIRGATFIWTLVVFGMLFALLSRFAWPQILEGMRKREENIRSARDEALAAKAEAERLRADLAQQMAQANAKINEMIDEARRDGQRMAEELRTRAQADMQAERERAQQDLASAKEQAMSELYRVAVQLATASAVKVIKRELQMHPDDQRRLVDEAVADLRTAGQGAVA